MRVRPGRSNIAPVSRAGRNRARFYAVLNVGISIIAGLGAAFLGWSIATAIWS